MIAVIRRRLLASFCAALCLLVAAGCGRSAPPRVHSAPVVTHDDFLRKATVDGRVIAFADTGNWQSELKYVAVLDLPAQCMLTPGRALLLGLGGGSVARNYRRQGWTVDVVEPDTARITLARTAFGFSDSVRMITSGGRDFLAKEEARYDVILLDCVSADEYPVDMLTKEFFALAASRLPETGIFAIAVESNGWKDEIVRALSATIASSFRQVLVLPIAEPPNMFGTIVLMGSNTVRNDLVRDPERNLDYSPEWRYGPEYQKTHAWDNHFSIPPDGMPPQTDGHNSWNRILADLRSASRNAPKDYLP
jgi:spermidine synthase